MKSAKKDGRDEGQLRQRRKKTENENFGQKPKVLETLSPEAVQRLFHELRASRDKYFDLYDRAPVGYYLLNAQGLIREVNQTFADKLGMTKETLLNQPLSRFIFHDDQEIYRQHQKSLFEAATPAASCELRMIKNDSALFWARLVATSAQVFGGETVVRALAGDITERKLAEEAQRRSSQMQTVLREIAEAAIVSSLDELYRIVHRLVGRVLPANYFLITLLDEAAGEIVLAFRSDAANVLPERRRIAKGVTEYVMRMGRAVHLSAEDLVRLRVTGEYTLKKLQKVKVHDYLGVPLTDSKGRPFGVISLVLMDKEQTFRPDDIEVLSFIAAQVSLAIERKQAETALAESEERFRTLVENVNDILYSLTVNGIVVYASPNWSEVLGHELDELIGHSFADFVHPEDRDACYAFLRQMIATGQKQSGIEFRMRHKNGKWRWYTSNAKPICDDAGTIVSYIGIAHDITDRKKAEEALRSSEVRYRTLIEQSFEALALVDIETQELVEVNRRFTELFGYSLPEDAPLHVCDFVEDSKHNLDILFGSTLRTQRVFPTVERIVRHKNGAKVPVERAGSVINIDGHDFYLVSMRDMTAERRLQNELMRDIEVARQIQMGLLPDLPESPLVTVRTLYYPLHFVSGDSYHMEWLNEGKVLRGFLIDVSGHGLATALQTSSVSVLLREATAAKLPFSDQLHRVNKLVAKYFTNGAYAAIIGFELDFQLREMCYVGAGITRLYANGKRIETPGMFVGLWDSPQFITGKLPIKAGDTFYFLTDGFTDWLAHSENIGFLSPDGNKFETDVSGLRKLAESGKLRDDATGICLQIMCSPSPSIFWTPQQS